MQMVQLSAIKCSRIAIWWVSLVSFSSITVCVASQRVFIDVSLYIIIDSVRKLLVTSSFSGYIPFSSTLSVFSFIFWLSTSHWSERCFTSVVSGYVIIQALFFTWQVAY
jgi:hypothetical protein